MITDNFIIETLISPFARILYARITPEIEEYLNSRFEDSDSLMESIVRIFHGIEEKPKCLECGKPLKFTEKIKIPFRTYCSRKCSEQFKSKTKKLIAKERFKKEELEKYGKLGLTKYEKYEISMFKKYGVKNIIHMTGVLEKRNNTNILKYGGKSSMHSKAVQENWKDNFNEKYGVNYPFQSDVFFNKFKKSCNEKYGVDYPAQSKEISDKTKQTCLYKYGVTCIFNTTENRSVLSSDVVKNKRAETHRKNGTFNTSKPEQQTYELLKTKFKDVEYQYKDKDRYPFICDFYIPSLYLFIECQYSWTHGGKPYNEITDKEKLELWKEKAKTSKYYQNAINTWTIRDVNKRETAKKNGLNYLEFFNIQEFLNWFEPQ